MVEGWEDGLFELVACAHLLDELESVVVRPKISRMVSEDRIATYLEGLATGTIMLDDPVEPKRMSTDPDDDYLVELAESSRADFLVSGDRHLTDLSDLKPPVLTPRQFVDRCL